MWRKLKYKKQTIYFCLKTTILFISIAFTNTIFAQSYIAGNTYYDSTGYVQYMAGNLPIIISAPHGGGLEPSAIPDRVCANCITDKDGWTKPIAEGLYQAFFEQTGCYPHLIINLLHRKKLDANREIVEAAVGNPIAEQAWYGYHNFIDSAKNKIVSDYGRGLFLDVHGHGHTLQRIELGYLLSATELRLTDSNINTTTIINESSIRGLVGSNILNASHATLLKGTNSFGQLLNNVNFLSVPSQTIPYPAIGEPYFDGGYNTQRHGSRDNNIGIDAIQIEISWDVRNDSTQRANLIDSLANVTNKFINQYYNNQYLNKFCNLTLENFDNKFQNNTFSVYPNPANNYIQIQGNFNSNFNVEITNYLGQKIFVQPYTNKQINVGFLNSGLYLLQIKQGKRLLGTLKFIKN